MVQLLACVCELLSICFSSLRQAARLLRIFADIVYCIVQACIQAQTDQELTLHPTAQSYDGVTITKAPAYQTF